MLVQIRRAQRALEDAFLRITTAKSHELHLVRHYLSWILRCVSGIRNYLRILYSTYYSVLVDFASSVRSSAICRLPPNLPVDVAHLGSRTS